VLDVYADPTGAEQAPPVAVPAPQREAEPSRVAATPPEADSRIADEHALLEREAEAMLGPASAPPSQELAASEVAPAEPELPSEAEADETVVAAEPIPGAPPQPAPGIRTVQRERGVIDWLSDPLVLAGLAIVMLALGWIFWRRRGAARAVPARAKAEAPVSSLFRPAGEEATGPMSEEGAGASASASDAGAPSEEDARSFDFEMPDEPEKPEVGPAQGAMLSTIGSVTSTAGYEPQSPTAIGGLTLTELERRLALLEQRLEEVVDAKDRLERQVSAQTEELRVQRAAIARTQRVLRTVVRPEDEPSEPVLKS
jgi:hypothetical protein